ncbi:MAG TPA: hypothetical protein PKD88_04445 [Nitrosomonas sp.]|nr:hypothetical protein [Nitrosomonas sp.]HMW20244.1 hypothetical protein [Nitrosomonas sp.]HMW68606.1 hypothetical protein [Nitrosomonas sp.]HMY61643.1 hypothetical protein [Nitrosomonas sp.]HMY91148.1 hypothetical protein [Nitrosomonas sp.]
MLKIKSILVLALLGISQSVVSANTHCSHQEVIVFNCNIGKKVVSICASPNLSAKTGYLQYHFGPIHSPELVFPSKKIAPHDQVTGGTLTFSGGGGAYLRFIRNHHRYVVYTAIGRGWGEKAGVNVEKNGHRKANLICRNQPISELGPDFFERAAIKQDPIGFELPE